MEGKNMNAALEEEQAAAATTHDDEVHEHHLEGDILDTISIDRRN